MEITNSPRLKIFVWKLIRSKLPTKEYLSRLEMDINPECPFCNNFLEDIDHLFKNCELTRHWNTIAGYCPNPNNNDLQFIDWIEFIYRKRRAIIRCIGFL